MSGEYGKPPCKKIPPSCFFTKISKFRETNKSNRKKIISWDLLYTFIGHYFFTDDTRLVVGSGIEPLAQDGSGPCSTGTELPLPKGPTKIRIFFEPRNFLKNFFEI